MTLQARLRWAAAGAAFMAGLCAVGAQASSDWGCEARWSVNLRAYGQCQNVAMLNPANDTRTNLAMLLHDRHGDVGPTDIETREYYQRSGAVRPSDFEYFASRIASGRKTPRRGADAAADPVDDYRGTRCQSDGRGRIAFRDAVRATPGLRAADAAALIALRDAGTACSQADGKQPIVPVPTFRNRTAAMFAAYAGGADAFYTGRWEDASRAFASATAADAPWLRETANYMVARTLVNQVTDASVSEYGGLAVNPANAQAVSNAQRALDAYLSAFPDGRYAASARGLLRRVHRLEGNDAALLADFVWQFDQPDPAMRSDSLIDLVQEFDQRLLESIGRERTEYQAAGLPRSAVTDPLILAVLDLKAMRQSDDVDDRAYDPPVITRAELDAQRPHFAGHDALYAYVLASHAHHVEGRPDAALALIPEAGDGPPNSYLTHSRRLLRALALDATNSPGARDALVSAVRSGGDMLRRSSGELALAMHEERHGGLARVFAADSLVTDPETRWRLLRYGADAALLRQQARNNEAPAEERAVAQFVLLYKQLTRGNFAAFGRDYDAMPRRNLAEHDNSDWSLAQITNVELFDWAGSADFACPALRAVASQLAANPRDAKALLCLGEFIRSNGLDPSGYGTVGLVDDAPPSDQLGGAPSLFPGARWSRLAAYQAIIADQRASADNRAYALYRAVRCYAPSGNNGCDATDVPLSQRRAWFRQLKTRYPQSMWAQQLEFYW